MHPRQAQNQHRTNNTPAATAAKNSVGSNGGVYLNDEREGETHSPTEAGVGEHQHLPPIRTIPVPEAVAGCG